MFSDPNPLVRGMDPRIRIHTKMSWIRNIDFFQWLAVFSLIRRRVVFTHDLLTNVAVIEGQYFNKLGWGIVNGPWKNKWQFVYLY